MRSASKISDVSSEETWRTFLFLWRYGNFLPRIREFRRFRNTGISDPYQGKSAHQCYWFNDAHDWVLIDPKPPWQRWELAPPVRRAEPNWLSSVRSGSSARKANMPPVGTGLQGVARQIGVCRPGSLRSRPASALSWKGISQP